MSPPRFDLTERPWLRARRGSTSEMVNLQEVFAASHELADLEVGLPPAGSGLWRLLTVIAARVTGLDDPGESAGDWLARRAEVLEAGAFDPDAVAAYFARYAGRFDLFDAERPWLQDPRLADECAKSSGVNKLVLGRPSGNNQPWMSHHHDRAAVSISVVEAVEHLVAQLYYGPSGRCTARTVNGTSEANTTAGPLRSVVSFHLVGASVFESLVTGIPYPEEDPRGVDAAPWELEALPNPLGIPSMPSGVGGVLAGRFRHAVLLTPAPDGESVVDARITWARREQHPPVEDPYLVYQTSKAGLPYARPASADRALWRDLDSLLGEDVGIEHRRRPDILDLAQELPVELLQRLRIRAYGFDQDGQTRDRQWHATVTPPVLVLLRDQAAVVGVSRAREAAERAEWNMRAALRNAWAAINDPANGDGPSVRKDIPPGPWPAMAAARYWPAAEACFWRRVRDRDFEGSAREFVSLAVAAFDHVTAAAAGRPRVARAIERARGFIFRALKPSKAGGS